MGKYLKYTYLFPSKHSTWITIIIPVHFTDLEVNRSCLTPVCGSFKFGVQWILFRQFHKVNVPSLHWLVNIPFLSFHEIECYCDEFSPEMYVYS